jgi:hypothetical protein
MKTCDIPGCAVLITMYILSNLYSNVKISLNGSPKNEISGLKRSFFDFRGMYLALLVFDNQEYCTLIDTVLRQQELTITSSTPIKVVWKRTGNLCFDVPAFEKEVDT